MGTTDERSRTSPDGRPAGMAAALHLAPLPVAFVADLIFTGVGLGPSMTRGGDPVPVALVVLAVLALALPLLLRQRRPLGVLVWTVLLSTALAASLDVAQPIACVLVALYAAARRTSRPGARLALGLGLVQAVATGLVALAATGAQSWFEVAFPMLFFGTVVVVVWAAARRDDRQQRRAELLASQLDVRAEEAAREERHRIARELHDILAHSVTAMMMQAAGARAITASVARDHEDDARLRTVQDALTSIEGTGSQSMRELHRLLGTMRGEPAPHPLDLDDDLTPLPQPAQPSLSSLEELLETARRSGLIVELHRSGTVGELDPSVAAAAYRVAQEALTNALRHAGRGAVVDVYEAWQGQGLQVQVRCRGSLEAPRPSTPTGGTGLRGLRERVELVGGTFQSGWVADQFVTTATLPARPGSGPGAGAGLGSA